MGWTLDGQNLVPFLSDPDLPSRRPMLYVEHFKPNHAAPEDYTAHRRAARDARYKLIRNEIEGFDRLYDLELDPFEKRDLLAAKDELTSDERRAYLDLSRWLAVHKP